MMRAMILAAGRGERMRPLTDHTPKPLLKVGGKPLIVWHIERLAAAGLHEIVINHAWLGEQLESALGDGREWGVSIRWSPEPSGGLETAGGIAQALSLLGEQPFLVINGDIWCDWNPGLAPALAQAITAETCPAWLLLVDNPPHHPRGDFWLDPKTRHVSTEAPGLDPSNPTPSNIAASNLATSSLAASSPTASDPATLGPTISSPANRYTFSGVGIYHPSLFAQVTPASKAPLAPLLRTAMQKQCVLGSHHSGAWVDVGTPERLQQLDSQLR